jgi:hypothetical protein
MRYVLTGFTHDMGFRVFAFDGVADDRARSEYRVRTDLALTRRYGIRMQELPLLCRGILERRVEDEEHAFTYSEADMRLHADVCAARDAEAKKKKAAFRKPPSENVGAAWRRPQL